MALSTRIVTRRTKLFAALLTIALLAAIGIVAEYVEEQPSTLGLQTPSSPKPGGAPLEAEVKKESVFPPSTVRPGDRLCGWTADQVHRHYSAYVVEQDVQHARALVGLTNAYLEMQCPSRIHEGSWDLTAEILGIGLVRERLVKESWFAGADFPFDPLSSQLVPAATTTFEILAPLTMCRVASRGDRGLTDECRAAFGWFY